MHEVNHSCWDCLRWQWTISWTSVWRHSRKGEVQDMMPSMLALFLSFPMWMALMLKHEACGPALFDVDESLETTKHTQPTSWFQAASKEWELQVFNPVRMQSLHLVLSTSLSTWKSAPSEGNLWWAHFWTQWPAVLGDGVLLRLWLGWKG